MAYSGSTGRESAGRGAKIVKLQATALPPKGYSTNLMTELSFLALRFLDAGKAGGRGGGSSGATVLRRRSHARSPRSAENARRYGGMRGAPSLAVEAFPAQGRVVGFRTAGR